MTDKPKWDIRFESQIDPLPADCRVLRTVAETVMRRFRERRATISITLVNDELMQEIHKQFLQDASTTDVMSFDLTDEFERQRTFEVVVNAEMAARQAQQRGHSIEAELALYITHGLLHNLGFDDDTPQRSARMHDLEDAILTKLGFADIYFDSNTTNGKE
jgi:probable rRNA maturation factor